MILGPVLVTPRRSQNRPHTFGPYGLVHLSKRCLFQFPLAFALPTAHDRYSTNACCPASLIRHAQPRW
jgi:hypothetical protein